MRCTDNGKKTTYTAGLLKNLIIQERLDEVRIDDSSVANGVTDILLENTALRKKIVPIKFGEKARKHPKRFANIASGGYWDLGQLVRNHEVQLTDNYCWRAQLPKIEMEYCSDGRLRVHKKGVKRNNPSPDESDSLMLAFLELGKKRVKFYYEGGGGLGEDFWDDGED